MFPATLKNQEGHIVKYSDSTRRILPLVLSGLSAAPLATGVVPLSAWAATHSASKTQTFKGPSVNVDHGPVQVSIIVKSKKIVSVKTVTSPEGPRSQFIQQQAIPILKRETLTAQSARIDEVSNATDTSSAYITSLQAAVKKARQSKVLK